MGRNNVRKGSDLLQRAGSQIDIASVIPEFGDQPRYIVGHDMSQIDLERFINVIRHGQNDAWMQPQSSLANSPITPATNCLVTCEARNIIRGFPPRYHQTTRKPVVKESDVVFILVVQGRSGSNRSKFVLRTGLEATGAELFFEAANGFSVVFSGAMLKTNMDKRRDVRYGYKRESTLEELVSISEDDAEKMIGVLC
ncbi:uncharacterized protein BDZ99DRAFT_526742 [Mytilinidion resinicola]|uniref:Uncharacterized protein n=1 Tax=Mytilinidion resinicola TaxID=574789 RepID=A0A6A6Y3I5_9PEZI|nr:uncharacterized protein BDZ99DRAFT_526742 [Mytilinidion resinicola]KAF2803386.1 hypothetical protein BDZ99DRAFT_526742 [Mytilinidion resinicola]